MLLRPWFRSNRHYADVSIQLLVAQGFHTDSNSISKVWRDNYIWTSPVQFTPGSQTPSALQWAKRRGPAVHHGYLRSLFRKGKIKMFLPATGQIKSITERTTLIAGDQLLVPKDVSDLQPVKEPAQHIDLTTPAALKLVQQLRNSILHKDDDMLIINKPQGLPVQGGRGIGLSLDKVMVTALQFDAPEVPRLVHRLDKDATGCLVIARTADAAAWLSLAFAQHAKSAADATLTYAGATVQRSYIALVQQSAHLRSNPTGCISEPLVGRAGLALPASTLYRTLQSHEDFALLQLTPKTGRKHQLRIHCANALSAPIVGDTRYGSTRSPLQRSLLKSLQAFQQTGREPARTQEATDTANESLHWQHAQPSAERHTDSASLQAAASAEFPEPSVSALLLQLHAHTICVQKPQAKAIKAQAKIAGQMETLLRHFSWTLQLLT